MKKFCIVFIVSIGVLFCNADLSANVIKNHLYVGVLGGSGSGTWSELIMKGGPQEVSTVSTPIDAHEGGGVWGFLAGYQFSEHYAVQLQYMKFKKARVILAPYSDYDIDNPYQLTFYTNSEVYSAITKFMLPFPKGIPMSIYSDFGIALNKRSDRFARTKSRWTPTFGLGLIYYLGQHWMFDGSFDYITGYGKSEVDPIYDYIPFLYAGSLKISYRF